jgi:3-deoxy-7-phosphoheptulonate synthase
MINILNPLNSKGKIILITRYGVDNINENFRNLIEKIKLSQLSVIFVCDPNHGNTKTDLITNKKVRYFEDLKNEILITNNILIENGYFLSGIHLEATYLNTTECFGGLTDNISEINPNNYLTYCDPRINLSQTVDLADSVGKALSNFN